MFYYAVVITGVLWTLPLAVGWLHQHTSPGIAYVIVMTSPPWGLYKAVKSCKSHHSYSGSRTVNFSQRSVYYTTTEAYFSDSPTYLSQHGGITKPSDDRKNVRTAEAITTTAEWCGRIFFFISFVWRWVFQSTFTQNRLSFTQIRPRTRPNY